MLSRDPAIAVGAAALPLPPEYRLQIQPGDSLDVRCTSPPSAALLVSQGLRLTISYTFVPLGTALGEYTDSPRRAYDAAGVDVGEERHEETCEVELLVDGVDPSFVRCEVRIAPPGVARGVSRRRALGPPPQDDNRN